MSELRLTGLAHAYALKTVLEDIDLVLPAGRILALVGPSGCGKTTLLHLAAGLLTVQTGELRNGFGRPAAIFQQPRLLPWKTTRDNIALGLKAAELEPVRPVADEMRIRNQHTWSPHVGAKDAHRLS